MLELAGVVLDAVVDAEDVDAVESDAKGVVLAGGEAVASAGCPDADAPLPSFAELLALGPRFFAELLRSV